MTDMPLYSTIPMAEFIEKAKEHPTSVLTCGPIRTLEELYSNDDDAAAARDAAKATWESSPTFQATGLAWQDIDPEVRLMKVGQAMLKLALAKAEKKAS